MTATAPLSTPQAVHLARRHPQRGSLPLQWLMLTFLAALTALAAAVEPDEAGPILKRAVFAEGRLWVLSATGDLSSVSDSQYLRVPEALPERTLELCVHEGHPLVATAARDGATWTLRQRSGETWEVVGAIATNRDGLLAMHCAADRITLLTTRRLVDLQGGKRSTVALSEALSASWIYSTYGTSQELYAGINAGEWGGGLRRIDRRSGRIKVIESNPSGELCGGPLNTRCDPVNGITAEPGKPECIVAAVGLVHFVPDGRVVEVCAGQVRELYSKPFAKSPAPAAEPGTEVVDLNSGGTTAFFGLVRAGNELWAVATDGLYNLRPDGAVIVPLPELKDAGGLRVGFLPNLAVVLTYINQRHSVSGAAPLIVAR